MNKFYRCMLSIFLLLCFVGIMPLSALASEPIGMVLAMEGSVVAQRGGTDVPLAVKDVVHDSDVVRTGAGSKVQILLNDESSITLGPDTNLELQEFADSGKDSAFAAHIGQGSMRLITGRITEANPDGFKVTTPMATVGIRGTLLVFDVSKDRTMVDFHNSSKTLIVNGTSILENNRIIITADDIKVNTLALQDKATGASFAVAAGGSSVSEDDDSVAALDADGNPLDSSALMELKTFEDVMQNVAPMGRIEGVFIANTGVFSFDVNLTTGGISNTVASGERGGTPWNVYGGSGMFYDGAFRIAGFSGSYGSNVVITDGTWMTGYGSYANVGDTINDVLLRIVNQGVGNPGELHLSNGGVAGERVK